MQLLQRILRYELKFPDKLLFLLLNICCLNCCLSERMKLVWIFRMGLMRIYKARERRKRGNRSEYRIKCNEMCTLKCGGAITIFTVVILQVSAVGKKIHIQLKRISLFKAKEKMRFHLNPKIGVKCK